jgi:hypothetical protein
LLGANGVPGDVAAVWVWPGTELTASQVSTFSQAVLGLLGTRGEIATFSNAGPICYWADGAISCASDDAPLLGMEQPPGLAAAGSPSSGYFVHPSVTNALLSSRDLSTNWTVAGTSVVACAQSTTPFRDARTTCKLTDDSAAASEYVHQSVDISALNTADKVQVCLYARADSAQTLDLQVAESGVCGGSTINFTAASLTTSWTLYSFTHSVADGTCTTANYRIAPADFGSVANQGHAYVVAQLFKAQDYCPPIYCETTAAGVTCGGGSLAYSLAQPIVSATGTIVGTERVSLDWTPLGSSTSTTGWIVQPYADAGNNWVLYGGFSPVVYWFTVPGGANYISDSSALAAGTTYRYDMVLNYDRDVYQLRRNGAVVGSASNALNSPAGLTTLYVGANSSGTAQMLGGHVIRNVRVYR